jgi:hypothetical protein
LKFLLGCFFLSNDFLVLGLSKLLLGLFLGQFVLSIFFAFGFLLKLKFGSLFDQELRLFLSNELGLHGSLLLLDGLLLGN